MLYKSVSTKAQMLSLIVQLSSKCIVSVHQISNNQNKSNLIIRAYKFYEAASLIYLPELLVFPFFYICILIYLKFYSWVQFCFFLGYIRLRFIPSCLIFMILPGCLLNNVALTIFDGSLLKNKRCNRRGQKNIRKKSIQTKINSYINKYIKRKHYKTLRIFVI